MNESVDDLMNAVESNDDVPESGLTITIKDGEKCGMLDDRAGETIEYERLDAAKACARVESKAGADLLTRRWADFADKLDRDLGEDKELVYCWIPGWFANIEDNEETRRTLERLTDWDGHDGSKVGFWAVRDLENDQDTKAYCITEIYNENRGTWATPPVQYKMIWAARSCSTIMQAEGEPTEVDHQRLRQRDGYKGDTVGFETDDDPEPKRILGAARHRAMEYGQDQGATALAEAIEQFKEDHPEAMNDKLTQGLGEFLRSRMTLVDDPDVDKEANAAAFIDGLEAFLDHVPAEDTDETED